MEVEPGTNGTKSDHRIAFVEAKLQRMRTFEWQSYTYRFYNSDSVDKFGNWLAEFDWSPLFGMSGSNQKADFYQEAVTAAWRSSFPS